MRQRFDQLCPVAESLQPRLLQFQTNNLVSAERNAKALRRAIVDFPDTFEPSEEFKRNVENIHLYGRCVP